MALVVGCSSSREFKSLIGVVVLLSAIFMVIRAKNMQMEVEVNRLGLPFLSIYFFSIHYRLIVIILDLSCTFFILHFQTDCSHLQKRTRTAAAFVCPLSLGYYFCVWLFGLNQSTFFCGWCHFYFNWQFFSVDRFDFTFSYLLCFQLPIKEWVSLFAYIAKMLT